MSTRLEIAFYRRGAEYGVPTVVEWSAVPKTVSRLHCTPGQAAYPYDLLAVDLQVVMLRVDRWILARARTNINSCRFGPFPVLFRLGLEEDLLPTGVVPFEVPIIDFKVDPPKQISSEMWHVTLRGCGESA